MAQRRMLSRRITESAKFLRMPLSTQALYFHLVISADDDGVVEAFAVMRKTNASDDDLRLLVAKNFVIMLNEDMVAYITDWNENNRIRADRKVDSIYQKLLLKVVPNAEIKRAKPRADTGKKTGSENGRPADNQRTPQDSIGEVSIGEDSSGQVNLVEDNSVDGSSNESKEETSSPTTTNIYDLYQSNFGVASPIIIETISQDVNDYGEELVIEAMKRAKLSQANYRYAQGILKDWASHGVKTLADVQGADAAYNQKQQRRQGGKKVIQKETLPDWAMDDYTPPVTTKNKEEAAQLQKEVNEKLAKLRSKEG
ncbi:DnaD domain-containing protein [Pediococcus acidilactici]|uniref:DnaD domain-containing protein n=1 Tax=Pediococcus acidilactici TaxID=1254 RepID=UPI00232D39AE|nr:DnaD domain protein [Pediococcus acidilactici]MDB8860131.1 DnaD domain protein [Pediococcus acidilactici]MDB8861128.1 DnaD domain protein [Pediococcus acidilactici]MDB8863831.1 DnaD domain protein [Pediococcus acidilactici]MDB8866019.1 DnaD domain protein [Pediococcus acidilactici]